MFVAREVELEQLNKFYHRKDFQIIALYGRRRVGKTELLKELVKDKKHLFFSAEETTDLLNLKKVSECYSNMIGIPTGDLTSWEQFFEYVAIFAKKERLTVVIDEFPYLASSNSGFLSKFQHIIDHKLAEANILLVLCGSSIGFMEEEVFSQKSPLFGRLNGQIFVRPFDYIDSGKMLNGYTNQQKLESYFVLGGIPQYLKKFNTQQTVDENIIEFVIDSTQELYHAPENLIRQELRSPTVYNSILEVVSQGASKSNEIHTKIGVQPNIGQNYINTLINLHLLVKKQPVGGSTTRKTIYQVADPLFDFIFRFVYRYRSPLELGLGKEVFEKYIKGQLATYYGKKFEMVCTQYMQRKNKLLELPDIMEEIGTWWGGNHATKVEEEIDIVALNKIIGIYGECKYTEKLVGIDLLEELMRKSLLIPKVEMYYYLFSKVGFTKDLIEYSKQKENIVLVGLEDLFFS